MIRLFSICFATILILGSVPVLAQVDVFTPIANCPGPLAGQLPAGQANPSAESEPMGPIWCFTRTQAPTTRITAGNSWVDDFNTGLQMGVLENMGYNVFKVDSGHSIQIDTFTNANHWMIDQADISPYNLSGGQMLSPQRSFAGENGKLVVEADMAAGSDAAGGATMFYEVDLSPAAEPGVTVDTLYGYGQFGGVGGLGCRFERAEDGGHIVCAMYDNSFHDAGGNDLGPTCNQPPDFSQAGCHPGLSGRVWETQGIGTERTAAIVDGGYPDWPIPNTNLHVRDVWRICADNVMDINCRDRFRMEITRDNIDVYVNGFLVEQIHGLYAVNPATGADNRVPDAYFAGSYVYFTSWINANGHSATRWHWDRVAVNPHDIGSHLQPPTSAPSFCIDEPNHTCPLVLSAVGLPVPSKLKVDILDFVYNPQTVNVSVGDTVTWTNAGQQDHTVTSNSLAMNSGTLPHNGQYHVRFDVAGSFPYFCTIHTGMTGVVNVFGSGAPQPTATSAPVTSTVAPVRTSTPTLVPATATAVAQATATSAAVATATSVAVATVTPTPPRVCQTIASTFPDGDTFTLTVCN